MNWLFIAVSFSVVFVAVFAFFSAAVSFFCRENASSPSWNACFFTIMKWVSSPSWNASAQLVKLVYNSAHGSSSGWLLQKGENWPPLGGQFLSLCVCDLFFLCRCWCSFVFQEQRQRVRLSGSLLVVDEVRTRGFQNTRPQELSASPFQRYDGCIGWLILILQPLQTIVELARCERVMTIRAEFHFSWVYTFSATPRSLRIWAPGPSRETGCDPALPAQLCWSSGSSFPHRLSDSM